MAAKIEDLVENEKKTLRARRANGLNGLNGEEEKKLNTVET